MNVLSHNYYPLVQAIDGGSLLAEATGEYTVNNIAPSILTGTDSLTPSSVNTGTNVTFVANFTDPGVLDNKTVIIDWGDNSTDTTLTFANNGSTTNYTTGNQTHQYATAGTYTVTVTISDNDGGVVVKTYSVVVTATPVTTTTLSETGAQTPNASLLGILIISFAGIALKKFSIL